MSRIRTVKPELFKHEDLYDLECDTGLPIRLAFIAMFTVADREGRFKWRPRTLKVECLPHDECDFSRVLDALATRGFIVKYATNGETYGYIPSFNRHQVVNNREHQSELPTPNENNTLTRGARVDDAWGTPLVQDQGEGKGREQEGKGIRDANASLVNAEIVDLSVANRAIKAERLRTIGEAWNALASELGLAAIETIKPGSQRESHALARAKELSEDFPDLVAGLNALIAKIRGSPLLRGEVGNRQWRASFDWVMNASNFTKIMEGQYEVREAAKR